MKNIDVINSFLCKNFNKRASSVSSQLNKLFSYNTVIGQWFDNTLLINITKYSVTTSTSQNELISSADKKGINWYTVKDVSINTKDLTYKYNG